jgi:hypothetical protein
MWRFSNLSPLPLLACLSGCHLLLEFPSASIERAGSELGQVKPDGLDAAADASWQSDWPSPNRCHPAEVITAEADACLVPGGMSTANYGSSDVCNLRYSGTPGQPAAAILKFETQLAAASLTGFELELTYAQSSKACGDGSTCTSCDKLSKSGTLELRPMTSAWVETEVTWSHREYKNNLSWSVMTTGEGVGLKVAESRHDAGNSKLIFRVDSPQEIQWTAPWLVGGRISFRVMPSAAEQPVFVAALRETGTECQASQKPTIRLYTCH